MDDGGSGDGFPNRRGGVLRGGWEASGRCTVLRGVAARGAVRIPSAMRGAWRAVHARMCARLGPERWGGAGQDERRIHAAEVPSGVTRHAASGAMATQAPWTPFGEYDPAQRETPNPFMPVGAALAYLSNR